MAQWSMRINSSGVDKGEIVFESFNMEADSFPALIEQTKHFVVNAPGWFRLIPGPNNPPRPLKQYAKGLQTDLLEPDWGDDLEVEDYFWVEIFEDGRWYYSSAQEQIQQILFERELRESHE